MMAGASDQTGDRLLWLAAGVIVLMGLTWLIVEAPWSGSEAAPAGETALATAVGDPAPAASETTTVASADSVRDPLRTARMALDAGMLIEPPDYSAWDLYGRVAAAEPDNVEAREGLEQVAAALLQRGNTALEQGRYDDAGGIAATITARFPRHAGAIALAAEVAAATAPPEPPRRTQREPAAAAAAEAAAPTRIDPIPALQEAFQAAMAQNAVLRPAGAVTSAVDVVREMLDTAPRHEATIAARDLLVTEMLSRSAQSIEALDAQAARTWIDAARPLAADPAVVARAEERLNEHLIETETQRSVPASDLEAVRTEPAEFPKTALNRGIEGWVEIEFVVSTSGNTEDVTVVDASHDRYFRDEAVAAVEGWQFEPYMFMGRAIPKRAYTRLEFVLN
jgi:TonB family protein